MAARGTGAWQAARSLFRRFALLSKISVALLMLGVNLAAAPALAQTYGTPSVPAVTPPTTPPPMCQADISKGARKALFDLQTAVFAKDAANIPPRLAAAQALAKTNDDKCFIGQMQMKAASDSNDLKGVAAALEVQLASGSVPPGTIAADFENVGRRQYNARAYDDANASFERALQLQPTRGSAALMLAETRVIQKRGVDAIPFFQKAISIELAAGRKPEENWYKRPLAIAFENKSPLTQALAREWLVAYPNPNNWRDAIRVHGVISGLGDPALIDMFRLARLNGALVGDADFGRFARVALAKGLPGEAKAVLDEGFAAGKIDRNQPTLKAIQAEAAAKAAGDRAALDAQARSATTAKSLMTLAEAYYGYSDYARSAELLRSAQGKAGVDAELANLRLGMTLAASGDKAGAKASLERVTGPRADIARYWLTYLATRP